MRARTSKRQEAEIKLGVHILNQMTRLGLSESVGRKQEKWGTLFQNIFVQQRLSMWNWCTNKHFDKNIVGLLFFHHFHLKIWLSWHLAQQGKVQVVIK